MRRWATFQTVIRRALLLAWALTIITPVALLGNARAASLSFSLDPSSANVTQGLTTAITIKAAAGTNYVQAVQACVTISDPTALQLTNIDYSSSPLKSTTPAAASSDCPAHEIQLGRFDTAGASGTFIVARLSFKALVANREVTIGIDDAHSFIGNQTASGSGRSTLKTTPVPAAEPSASPTSPVGSLPTPSLTDSKGVQAASIDVTSDRTIEKSASTLTPEGANSSRHVIYIVGIPLIIAVVIFLLVLHYTGSSKFATATATEPRQDSKNKD